MDSQGSEGYSHLSSCKVRCVPNKEWRNNKCEHLSGNEFFTMEVLEGQTLPLGYFLPPDQQHRIKQEQSIVSRVPNVLDPSTSKINESS